MQNEKASSLILYINADHGQIVLSFRIWIKKLPLYSKLF